MTINAGAYRLLVPAIHTAWIDDMRSAKTVPIR